MNAQVQLFPTAVPKQRGSTTACMPYMIMSVSVILVGIMRQHYQLVATQVTHVHPRGIGLCNLKMYAPSDQRTIQPAGWYQGYLGVASAWDGKVLEYIHPYIPPADPRRIPGESLYSVAIIVIAKSPGIRQGSAGDILYRVNWWAKCSLEVVKLRGGAGTQFHICIISHICENIHM